MCGRRLKIISLLLALLLLSLFFPLSASLCAEVRLTDEEATELMNEIAQSKKELENVKDELNESKKDLSELENQLTDVKNTYEEQKKSYEKQLDEAEKKTRRLTITASATSGASVALIIVAVLLILF